jgi:hypothetical protein
MVRYSKVSRALLVDEKEISDQLGQLAFRQTVAEYGVELAWTPMV